MFTGLVESQGIVMRAERVAGGAQFEIYAPEFGRDMAMGDSVAARSLRMLAKRRCPRPLWAARARARRSISNVRCGSPTALAVTWSRAISMA